MAIIEGNIPQGMEKVTINGEKVKEKLSLYTPFNGPTIIWDNYKSEGVDKKNKHLLNNKDYIICNSSVSENTMTLNLKYIPGHDINFKIVSERTITTELIGYTHNSVISQHKIGIHQNSDDTNKFWIIAVFTYQGSAYLNVHEVSVGEDYNISFKTKCTNILIDGITQYDTSFPDIVSQHIYRRLPNVLVDSNGVYMVHATPWEQFKFMTYQFGDKNYKMKTVCSLNAQSRNYISSQPGYLLKKGSDKYYYFFANTSNSFSYVEVTRDNTTATFAAAEPRDIATENYYKIKSTVGYTTIYEYNNSFYLFHAYTNRGQNQSPLWQGAELFKLLPNDDCILIKRYSTNSSLGSSQGSNSYGVVDSDSGCLEYSVDGRIMSFYDLTLDNNYRYDQIFSIYIITDPENGDYVKKVDTIKSGFHYGILGYHYDYKHKTSCGIYTRAFQYDELGGIRERGYAQHLISCDGKPLCYASIYSLTIY